MTPSGDTGGFPRLRFRHDFHVEIMAPDLVFLLSENSYTTLKGALYVLIAPLLDGQYDVPSLVRALQSQVTLGEIQYTLQRLRKAGYVVEHDETLPTATSAYFEMQGADPRRLQTAEVAVHELGGVSAAELIATLGQLGIKVNDANPQLHVVLTDDYLHPDLVAFNREMLQAGSAWMLVKPTGASLWIGPLLQPGQNACWECLAQRLRGNRRVQGFLEQQKQLASPIVLSLAALPSTVQTAVNIAATEIARWLTTGHSSLSNQLLTFDTLTLETRRHTVIHRPQCPVCGKVQDTAAQPVILQSRAKVRELDGGYRSASPAETLARYEQHVSPITGVVSLLAPLTRNELIYLYTAGDNKLPPLSTWELMRASLRSLSIGKGIEEVQAKASGLCEALERYSGVFQRDEPRCEDAYMDVMGEAIFPGDLLGFSETQYREREHWNETHPPHMFVPQRFEERRAIDWSPIWSLTEQRSKLVPTAYCYYGYPLPDDYVFCSSDSNGNAAGSSLEDAIVHGFLELVERDAVAIWWYNRIQRPAVDLDSLKHPYIEKMRAYYASLCREFWVLDITTDLNIFVCTALSRRTDKPTEDIIMASGAHFDIRVAVLRALTELNQMLAAVSSTSIDGSMAYHSESRWEIKWWQTATVSSEPYLMPDSKHPPTTADDYAPPLTNDLRDDVTFCVETARQHGMEVLVLDQTRPDIGLPVVKVIVPGMSHFWGHFAPGRLYAVPVARGWLASPTPEEQLNPWPMFL